MSIEFKMPGKFMGLNGIGLCAGLAMAIEPVSPSHLTLIPITSKGKHASKCFIDVEISSIPQIIAELQSVYNLSKSTGGT
jgi:hypothetical protein